MVRMGTSILALGITVMLLPMGNGSYMIGFLLMGAGCSPIFPCLIHKTPLYFGKENSASVIGLQLACANIGGAVMPPLFGVFSSFMGYGILPLFLCALAAGMTCAIEVLNRRYSNA